jgi:CHAT domain-containing protein
LILTLDGVQVLGLPGIDPQGVVEQVNGFLASLADAHPDVDYAVRVAAEQRLTQILQWVWDHVTGPILDHLGFTAKPTKGEKWPRVWWCPSGPLAVLPLQAAGHHDTRFDTQPAAVIDRVVSSTIPTVRAVLHARQSTPTVGVPRVLVVAMPHTPDQVDLPGTQKEAEFLAGRLPGQVDVVGLADTPPATFATVTAALGEHAWAHFACHGTSDLDDPSASLLLLEDYQSRPLTVLDLTHQRLEDVELAFLSACTTARVGAALPDEPIHLAGACQMAGYRDVIATLWPIDDNDAVRVTKHIYTILTTPNRSYVDAVAIAVHEAVRGLRILYPDLPSRWAAHTHIGP